MYQFKKNPAYYRNIRYGIDFYHDFSPFVPFSDQIQKVSEKYHRRIERFYRIIKEPTLFVRYATEEELEYVFKHHESILKQLQKFNPENSILFVANRTDNSRSSDASVYYVDKDENDVVCRRFLDANEDLKQFILERVEKAEPKKSGGTSLARSAKKEKYGFFQRIRLKLNLVYHHNRRC
jgi:hypothetical protein